MSPQNADPQIADFERTRATLHPDLIVSPQTHGGERYYHLELPAESKFYRIGYAEYVFLSLLDGDRTFAQALTLSAQALGAEALDRRQANQCYQWLLENGLARLIEGSRRSKPTAQSSGLLRQLLNPFWIRVPLADPDAWIDAALPWSRWFLSPASVAVGTAFIVASWFALFIHWSEFMEEGRAVLQPDNWLWLAVAWVALKVIHELAHALSCKRHGGRVREMGLIFILMAPMAYVDVTSSWRFGSKWKRMHVAAAGMYAELLVASCAIVGWLCTDSLVWSDHCRNIVIAAGVATVLFNANPLMRFDGYYLLSDGLEIPNLYEEANRRLSEIATWIWFGRRSTRPRQTGWRGAVVLAYGVAAAVWRLLVCVSLLVTASVLFQGAGVVLAVVGGCLWSAGAVRGVVTAFVDQWKQRPASLARASLVSAVVGATLLLLWLHAPAPGFVNAPGVVEYRELSAARSQADGFVKRVLAVDGQFVREGDLVIELENRELRSQARDLALQISQTTLRQRQARERREWAEVQVHSRDLQALQEQQQQLREQLEQLAVRAPADGRLAAPRLAKSVGGYVRRGEELFVVGDEQEKEIRVALHQDDVDQAVAWLEQSVSFRDRGGRLQRGAFVRLSPRASRQLPHPAMGAAAGGPLAIQDGDEGEPVLTEPRFQATVEVGSRPAASLRCGQVVQVHFGPRRERLATFLVQRFQKWIASKVKLAEAS